MDTITSNIAAFSLVSKEVSGLIFEILLEIEWLDKAIAEASFFSGQEIVGLQTVEATLGALWHCLGSWVVVELLLQILCQNVQVELSLHFTLLLY